MHSQEIVQKISGSKKYQHLYQPIIQRIVSKEVTKYQNEKRAVKAVKAKLHRIYGAFSPKVDYQKIWHNFEEARVKDDKTLLSQRLDQLLGSHSSTQERLHYLKEFYQQIFSVTGEPKKILDIGCGLNPLTLIKLNMNKDIQWYGLEADAQAIDLINGILGNLGYTPLCRAEDLAGCQELRLPKTDITLLLKMIQVLDYQKPNLSLEIIKKLKADWLIVSVATKSLGNYNRSDSAKQQLEKLEEKIGKPVTRLEFPGELVDIFKKENLRDIINP